MNFETGAVRLSDIVNGTLEAGSIPWQRLNSSPVFVRDTSITVTTPLHELLEIDLGTLTANDWVWLLLSMQGQKGGTAGEVAFICRLKSGTGSVVVPGPSNVARVNFPALGANDYWRTQLWFAGRVATGGTVVLKLEGQSTGSDFNAGTPAGSVDYYVWIQKGPVQ